VTILNRVREDWGWPAFLGFIVVQLWAAHACVFFAHEYAHSFTAWLMGWKSNPLALNYAHPTMKVLLLQLGIDQNVDEARIYASGHGVSAAIIAGAGMVIGNGLISYPLSRWGYVAAKRRGSRARAMFAYWCCVASFGNFLDYVPVRTFTSTGDMGSVERGFGWSPWTVVLVLGIPTLIALGYLFLRIEPETIKWLFPESNARRVAMAVLTAFVMFAFYGSAGLLEGGPISFKISKASLLVVFPIMAAIGAWRFHRVPYVGSAEGVQ
jgi:hypothetical protein